MFHHIIDELIIKIIQNIKNKNNQLIIYYRLSAQHILEVYRLINTTDKTSTALKKCVYGGEHDLV